MERVGLNLLWLVPGVVGGSEISTVATLAALAAEQPGDVRHALYVLDPFVERYPELADAFETHVLPLSGRVKGARVAAEQTWLHRRARRDRLDALHHMGGTMPLLGGPSALLSIHDLQPFDHPERFPRARRAWLSAVVPRGVRRARVVLTPSDWVRGSVVGRFGVDPDKVVTVPHALPPMEDGTDELTVRRRYDIPGDFVLYPTITYPHKGHVTLVEAFARLAADRPDLTLVLSGGEGASESEVRAAIDASGVAERVRRTGAIPRADVVGLLDAATVVAVPSRYEGFGMPALEAMARGCPLVAADATALPEVVGDAGVLAPVGDAAAWAAALSEVVSDPDLRAGLGERGRQRAEAFSVESNLAGTLALHRRVLAGDEVAPPADREGRQR